MKDAAQAVCQREKQQTALIGGEDIVVSFSGQKEEEAELLKTLVDGGIPVSGFLREHGDLETIFMQLTNHDLETEVIAGEG